MMLVLQANATPSDATALPTLMQREEFEVRVDRPR